MLELFLQFIIKEKLIEAEEKVLLAVSGGVDSVVMAHLFHLSKYPFAIAHCNFQLRGKYSDDDELFVKNLARQYEVPIFTTHFNTTEYARENGYSIEMAARELRYEWFEKIRKENGYSRIATAHHQNDVCETVLLNLTKGTGIAGLHGIRAQKGHIIRPLLFSTREMVLQYAKEQGLSWQEDHTNLENDYQRNLIRNKVIPELKKINPAFEKTMMETVEKLSSVEVIFEKVVEDFKIKAFTQKGNEILINKQVLLTEKEPFLLLFETIKEFGFSYRQTKDVFKNVDGESGKMFYSKDYQLNIDRENLIILPAEDVDEEIALVDANTDSVKVKNLSIEIETLFSTQIQIDKSPDFAFLDKDKITFPVKIRPWKEGDYFYPLGMKGKKKVSDFLIDAKVPVSQKTKVMVLESSGEIVWIIGWRIDDRFKITPSSQNCLKLSVKKN